MEKTKEIELSSIEATAYWWVRSIRDKVREMVIYKTSDKKEKKFVEIFYNYTEVEWRNLYLELVKYITEDVNNYVPIGNIMGIDAFNQDTAEKRHDRLNAELSNIVGCSVPDIRLAGDGVKDSVIYTNLFGASVWYKSCGISDLPTKYDPCYILTGDEEELKFYYLFLATIAVLKNLDNTFNSIPLLRDVFCNEYKIMSCTEKSIAEIVDLFNHSYQKADDNNIVCGRFWKETYFTTFKDIDYVGLDKYMEEAENYAKVILQEGKNNSKSGYSRKRVKNTDNKQ